MPEMTGVDLHADLRRVAPDQADAIVFMSAGSFGSKVCDFLEGIPNPRIDKPFDAVALRAFVRRLVEEARARAAPSSHEDSRR